MTTYYHPPYRVQPSSNNGATPRVPPPPATVHRRPYVTPASSLFECPSCEAMKGNKDAPSLRIHMFQHYRHEWEGKLNATVPRDALEIWCDRCPTRKRISGVTPEGARGTIICHWAIQHQELRTVLEQDSKVS